MTEESFGKKQASYVRRLWQGDISFNETFFGWAMLLSPCIFIALLTTAHWINSLGSAGFNDSSTTGKLIFVLIFHSAYYAGSAFHFALMICSWNSAAKLPNSKKTTALIFIAIVCYILPLIAAVISRFVFFLIQGGT